MAFVVPEQIDGTIGIHTESMAFAEKLLDVVFLTNPLVFWESLLTRHGMKRFGRQEVYFFLLFLYSAAR